MKTFNHIIRPFGVGGSGDSSRTLWPLDIIRQIDVKTVPGFIIEIDATGLSMEDNPELDRKFWGALKKEIARLDLSEDNNTMSDRKIIVEWRAKPDLKGLSRRFEALELGRLPKTQGDFSNGHSLLELKRFIERFSANLKGYSSPDFIEIDHRYLTDAQCLRDRELSEDALKHIIVEYENLFMKEFGNTFPHSLFGQLKRIISCIFTHWKGQLGMFMEDTCNPWLSIYIRLEIYSPDRGLLGSGMFFTRLSSPESEWIAGYYSPKHSLAEVRAGIAPLYKLSEFFMTNNEIRETVSKIHEWLETQSFQPVQVDFIITATDVLIDDIHMMDPSVDTAISIAAKMCNDEALWCEEAIQNVSPGDVEQILLPTISSQDVKNLQKLGIGIPAAAGACTGLLCSDPSKAEQWASQGTSVVFISSSPTPEVLKGVLAANGLVFATGGATSHVAVIARGSGKPCVLGIGFLQVVPGSGGVYFGQRFIRDGEWVTIDGNSGTVYAGRANNSSFLITEHSDLDTILSWCDKKASIRVYANVDVASEAKIAFALGAQGIGLCRLEHLLVRPESLNSLQRAMALAWIVLPLSEDIIHATNKSIRWPTSLGAQAILAETSTRANADPIYQTYLNELKSIRAILVDELRELLRCALGKPVVIRLLDPPLSEFLTESIVHSMNENGFLSHERFESLVKLTNRKDSMLGLRGIRLCHIAPELTSAQLSAIFDSAKVVADEIGEQVSVDIMAPFVIDPLEISMLRDLADYEARKAFKDSDINVQYRLGTMIETPRAALLAGELAMVSDFLSIGTNDLTQFTWACSRDYSETDFLGHFTYLTLNCKPFVEIDEAGVGRLISMAVVEARKAKPGISIGVCGEHGADPRSIMFFHRIGINYVSCTPLRIPNARLASAKAAIHRGKQG